MKFDDLKTRLAGLAGTGKNLKKLPHHILIPIGLVVLVILLVGFKLVAGFHHYQQRAAAAAVKSIAAAQAENAGGSDPLESPPLAGLANVPPGLAAGATRQTVSCPGRAAATTTLATAAAVFTAPASAVAGCTVTWRLYSQAHAGDPGFVSPEAGAPVRGAFGVIASGSPAATIAATVDGGHQIEFSHPAAADLAHGNGGDLGVGWHEYEVAAAIIGGTDTPMGFLQPKPLTVRLMVGADPAIPYWTGAGANPQIAQQPSGAPATPTDATAGAYTAVTRAPAVQPPEAVAAGWVTRKAFSRDQFGALALVSTAVEKSASLTVTAAARAGNASAQRVEWDGWIKLDQPASVAVLRLAGGQGTVSATIDGMPLGQPVERWPQSAASQQTASVSLAPGWHQFAVTDDEAAGTWGDGSSIQIAIGDGSTDPQPPVPWAVPAATAPAAIPRNACAHDACAPSIAQHQPASASSATASKAKAAATTGGAP
jgi:hypothetical protein